jgi:hypothetical protein
VNKNLNPRLSPYKKFTASTSALAGNFYSGIGKQIIQELQELKAVLGMDGRKNVNMKIAKSLTLVSLWCVNELFGWRSNDMGYDTTYTEYHLTPRGWIQGAWDANKLPIESTPPEDRIETWLQEETTHDTYPGKPTRDWKLLWIQPNHSEEERKNLRAKFRKSSVLDSRRLCLDFPS